MKQNSKESKATAVARSKAVVLRWWETEMIFLLALGAFPDLSQVLSKEVSYEVRVSSD
jgi:hypothetical protein